MVFSNAIIFFGVAFASLIAVANPLSTASIFLTITRRNKHKKKKKIAKTACNTAAYVLISFALVGTYILGFFSITLDAFRIAGGLIIVSIGFSMLKSKREHLKSDKEKREAIRKDDVSIIPLAIPMISGPGAITTVLILASNSTGFIDMSMILLAIIAMCLVSFLVLVNADKVHKYLGRTGKATVDKIVGLIVLVIGIQFIINGIDGLMMEWINEIPV